MTASSAPTQLPTPAAPAPATPWRRGRRDLVETVQRLPFVVLKVWHEVRLRYRRSYLGQFWLSLALAAHLAVLSAVFTVLSGIDAPILVPWIATGLILWQVISAALVDGGKSIIDNAGLILQGRPCYFALPTLVLTRSVIELAHNLPLLAIVFILFGVSPSWTWALVPLCVAALVLTLWPVAMVLAVLTTRFRDFEPMTRSLVQPLFFLTPIMWHESQVVDPVLRLVLLNPLAALLALVREPLLGRLPDGASLAVAAATALAAWAMALWLVGRFRGRIAMWL